MVNDNHQNLHLPVAYLLQGAPTLDLPVGSLALLPMLQHSVLQAVPVPSCRDIVIRLGPYLLLLLFFSWPALLL